jgi:2-dehydro-3-deoxyphosphogalactonate aldolase
MIIRRMRTPDVIVAAAARGLVAMPGIATPTEAFAALGAGAAALKLFPAEVREPHCAEGDARGTADGHAVLPVGGIGPGTLAPWREGRRGRIRARVGALQARHDAQQVGENAPGVRGLPGAGKAGA